MSSSTDISRGKIVEGVLAIHKPTGPTSAKVLNDIQNLFDKSALFAPWLARERANRDAESDRQHKKRRGFNRHIKVKVGHGGTLDPLATGVLITGIGRGTKDLNRFANHVNKSYEAVVLFGVATDTYDCEGKVIGRKPYEHVTEALVREKLAGFRGKGLQRPPIFSAIKQDGKPLYEYAREGKKPPREIEKREVDVLELELVEWMEGGRHNYKWPTEEATPQEKKFAEMLSEVDNVATVKEEEAQSIAVKEELEDEDTTNSTAEEDERPPTSNTDIKSKDLETNPSATKSEPSTKLKDTTSPPPSTHMSGALPNDPPLSTHPPLPPAVRIRMTVTSGFYVRSLCQAFGAAVNSCALMSSLIRTRQGEFELGKNVVDYEDFEKGEEVWGPKVEAALLASQGETESQERSGKRERSEDGSERGGKRQETRRRQRNSSSELSD